MISIETRAGKRAYETVAERVRKFREKYPVDSGWQIVTELQFPTDNTVLCRAVITDPDGRIVATGTAEETRGSTFINKTSAVENAETSAIGRALFSAGFGGGEFCSADELFVALKRQDELMAAETEVLHEVRKGQGAAPGREEPAEQQALPFAQPARQQQGKPRTATPSPEAGPDARTLPASAFGLPDDCGILFVQDGNIVFAKDQTKGATFNNREHLKSAGFSFHGRHKIWFKEIHEEVV